MLNFSDKYNKENFINFLKEKCQVDQINEIFSITNKKLFISIKKIAIIKLDEKIPLFEIEHVSKNDPRVELTNAFFSILNNYSIEKALVIFYCSDSEKYRFSLIESTLVWSNEINVKRKFSHPRRLSYLLGEDTKIHTPYNQFKKKIENYKDLKKRFDKEVVTEEFFNNNQRLYLNLIDKLEKDKKFKSFAQTINLRIDIFASKLMGQIIFCYFLQKKGWLGANRLEKVENGNLDFFRTMFSECVKKNKNFYNDYLEYIFYEGLNKNNQDQFCSQLNCKIPFLNGGLFEELKNYDWKKESIELSNNLFSNELGDGILDIFDLYNFTVDEFTNLDTEIAIDPEMLGKVFESLIPENLKKKHGVYYTNRAVVTFMCRDVLVSYLFSSLNYKISKKDLLGLFFISNDIKFFNYEDLPLKIRKYSNIIDHKLKKVRICDPAAGSGAFPIALMSEICKARQLLQTKKTRKNSLLSIKKNFIENSLYAVDIDPGSIEIAKLRLWLSIIVDEPKYQNELILPNLDFKIIEANSLLTFPIDVFNYDNFNKIVELKKFYYSEKNYEKRINIKDKIDKLINTIKEQGIFDFRIIFFEIFNSKKTEDCGFDIIIANPPYTGEKGNKIELEKIKNGELNSFYIRKMDYFYFFFHLAINILNSNGVASFVTTNYFITSTQGTKLRSDLKKRTQLLSLINFNEYKIFQSAKGQHNLITTFTKDQKYKQGCKTIFTSRVGSSENDALEDLFYGESNSEIKKEIDSNLIFEGPENYIRLDGKVSKDGGIENSVLNKIIQDSKPLDTFFDVSQGMITGIDKIKESHIKKFPNEKFVLGEGVYILSKEEIIKNNFKKNELELCKPFYKNSDIKKYNISDETENYVLYLTRDLNINDYPNIKRHITGFEKPIKARSQGRGEIQAALAIGKWWVVFGARNKRIFENPKIICPQRSKLNKFGYYEKDFFASADVYFILNKNFTNKNLKFLTAILNSKLFYFWFKKKGKVKGEMLELYYKPLCETPIKFFLEDENNLVEKKVQAIQNSNDPKTISEIDQQINDKIYKLYKLSKEEISFVNNFYPNNVVD